MLTNKAKFFILIITYTLSISTVHSQEIFKRIGLHLEPNGNRAIDNVITVNGKGSISLTGFICVNPYMALVEDEEGITPFTNIGIPYSCDPFDPEKYEIIATFPDEHTIAPNFTIERIEVSNPASDLISNRVKFSFNLNNGLLNRDNLNEFTLSIFSKDTVFQEIDELNILPITLNERELIAQYKVPFMIDNRSNGSTRYLSQVGDYLIDLDVPNSPVYFSEKVDCNYNIEARPVRSLGGTSDNSQLEVKCNGESKKYIYDQVSISPINDSITISKTSIQNSSEGVFVNLLDENGELTEYTGSINTSEKVTNLFANDNIAPILSFYSSTIFTGSVNPSQVIPSISGFVSDKSGHIDYEQISTKFKYLKDGISLDIDLDNFFNIDNNEVDYFDFEIDLSSIQDTLEDGEYIFVIDVNDTTGKKAAQNLSTSSFFLDRTSPVISTITTGNLLTNSKAFNVEYFIEDISLSNSEVIVNNYFDSSSITAIPDQLNRTFINLEEGLNTIKISSTDHAGNIATPVYISNIELDTIEPSISITSPQSSIVDQTKITFSFNIDEEAILIVIDGVAHEFPQGVTSFSKELEYFSVGQKEVNFEVYDRAGNVKVGSTGFNILIDVLNKDLISLNPLANGDIEVIGGVGACYPNVEIEFDAGFFNKETLTSNSDGSFKAVLSYFSDVDISAEYPVDNHDTENLIYNVDTTLSGIVLDYLGTPLPGVQVNIVGTNNFTNTTADGSWSFPNPITGDQIIRFRGDLIPIEVTGPNKKYSNVNIAVSIGVTQLNVIHEPIYLAPLIMDGTETEVVAGQGATVTSPHAPGVRLEIPASVTTFPSGSTTGEINMLEVSSAFTSVPVPEYAKPENVYALEPSGLKFSEPIELTLPNINEFPEGMQVVIMSKNSEKGIWEIDGIGTVDSGGTSITTNEGEGITHFSEVFAAPIAPQFKKFGGIEKAGTDSFNGSVSTSIVLPTYKSFGQNNGLSLTYDSYSVNPNVIVSNIFDIPRQEYHFQQSAHGRSLFGSGGVDVVGTSWVQPKWLDVQFKSNDIISEKMRFTGLPSKSVVSYAMDLSSQNTGVQPYQSSYELKLEHMIVGTKTYHEKKRFGGARSWQEHFSDTREIEKVFPSDISGSLIVDNRSNSKYGAGWKLNGVNRLTNVGGPRILLSGDSKQIFSLKSVIETIYESPTNDLRSVDFKSTDFPVLLDDKNKLRELDPISKTVSDIYSIPKFEGLYRYEVVQYAFGRFFCNRYGNSYRRPQLIENMVRMADGSVIFTDKGGLISKFNNDSITHIGGQITGIPSGTGNNGDQYNFCGIEGVECYAGHGFGGYPAGDCYAPMEPSSGNIQSSGFQDGALSSSIFNSPKGLTPGFDKNTFIVADFGNHRVRKVNLNNNTVITIAGNGQTNDLGVLGNAKSVSIYRPQGVAIDNVGNIYVSSFNGYIRKISPSGNLNLIAGRKIEDGGVFSDQANARDMNFNQPYGMVVDNDNGYLYVADTGYHRIVRINLANGSAETVAGNGTCTNGPNIGDGNSALNASLCNPTEIGLDDNGNLLVLDSGHNKIRKIFFNQEEGQRLAYLPNKKTNQVLFKNEDGTYELEDRGGNKILFNEKGLQIEVINRIGNSILYEYDLDENLTRITDQAGRETNLYYLNNLLSSIVDPTGRETSFTYENGELSLVTFPDSTTKSYVYQNGILTSEFDQRNYKTEYFYNQWQRLEKIKRSDGSEIFFQDKASITMGNNNTNGNTGALKNIGAEIRDGIQDAKGNETYFEADENSFVSKITDANNQVTTIERDLDGRPTKIIRPDESFTTFKYNEETNDLLEKYESETGVIQKFEYNEFGQITTKDDFRGNKTFYYYYANTGLQSSILYPNGQNIAYDYYSNGLIKDVINDPDGLNIKSSFNYDTYGNLSSKVAPDNTTNTIIRDDAGNVISATNANSQTVAYEYDLFNRLLSVTTPKLEKTTYEYLSSGQFSKVIDPIGNTTLFTYDSLGRLISKTNPLGFVTALDYDPNGNLIQEIDPNGVIKTFEYNSLNQLTKKILPDNIYEYDYDVRGNLTLVFNNHSQVEYEYTRTEAGYTIASTTSKGLGIKSYIPEIILDYTYDFGGNRTSMSTQVGLFEYDYDNSNRLIGIENHKNEVFEFYYDKLNRLVEQTRPGSKTKYTYDTTSFVEKIVHEKLSNTNIKTLDYLRDAIGNKTQLTVNQNITTYDYDNNNQLIEANSATPSQELFSYDSLGNRTTDSINNYVYDLKKQRLYDDGTYLYYYDNNGNLISKISKSNNSNLINYIYNSENQLISIETFESNLLIKKFEYSYDVLGRRIEKIIDDFIDDTKDFQRRYVYDGSELLFEFNDSNTLLATYTNSLLRMDDTLAIDLTSTAISNDRATQAGTLFYLKDSIGTIRSVVDSSGEIIQKYLYSSSGKILDVLNSFGSSISGVEVLKPYLTFTNRELDTESSLLYYRARYYDSVLGRFLSADPHPGALTLPLTHINKYIYAANNPLSYIDPNGRFIVSAVLVGGAISAGLAALNRPNGLSLGTSLARGFVVGVAAVSLGAVVSITAGAIGAGVVALGATAGAGAAISIVAGAILGYGAGVLTSEISAKALNGRSATGKERLLGGVLGVTFGSIGGYGVFKRVQEVGFLDVFRSLIPFNGSNNDGFFRQNYDSADALR